MLKAFLVRFGLVIALLFIWQCVTFYANSIFFPTPIDIIKCAFDLWLSGPASQFFLTDMVFTDIIPSIGRLFVGWLVAVIAGVLLGVLVGRSRTLLRMVNPAVQFLRAVPGPALIPVFIILLGTETTMRVTLIAFGSVWPVLLNTIEGVRTVDPVQLDTARAFRLGPVTRLFRIVLPAASPKILAGARVSLSLAVILMVVSELVASTNGIGFQILNAQMLLMLTEVWCGIVLLAFLGFGLNALYEIGEHRLLHWHRGARRRA